ncbi:NAD-dependent deacetylase sirtuin-6 [Elysia marginata]|uniref:NAD-dependent deacetylase sirtuin-6 n=1 Tax=Elysia marginata TaxID=1093978 RepID=A0AAV4FSP2_9GAST|nr:NAD-dependent deacetylase sirtuin-6 [Elysia marginata]
MAARSPQARDNVECCFKNCESTSKVLKPGDGRVDVRAFESKAKQAMVVKWKEGATATFHRSCWAELYKATQSSSSPISLSDVERSMILDANKTAEYHDSDAAISQAAENIVHILQQSSYCIAFTGAGISTAAGIGDYRGIHGKWTEKYKVKNYGAKGANKPAASKMNGDLQPTYSHEALVKLQDMGLLKFLISQNTDGLHMLSGIPADKMAELHGNSYVEKCEDCGKRYERSYPCRQINGSFQKRCPRCRLNHRTGRKCSEPSCNGFLMNTIINFGDFLESDVIDQARQAAVMSDAVLVLGSTLMVSPANVLVTMGKKPARLIICNRQITPYDGNCCEVDPDGQPLGSRVFGDCDNLMKKVMSLLLPPKELKTWEDGRRARLMEYGLKRTFVRNDLPVHPYKASVLTATQRDKTNAADIIDLFVMEQLMNSCSKELYVFLRKRKPADSTELVAIAEKYIETHGSAGAFARNNILTRRTPQKSRALL